MATLQTEIKAILLRHPELDTPPVMTAVTGHWRENGRVIGLVLDFADGPRSLTYEEIAELRREEGD